MKKIVFKILSVLLLIGLLSVSTLWSPGFSQISSNTLLRLGKASFTGKFEPETARPGEEVRAVIDIEIADRFHIYSVVPSEDEDVPPPTKVLWQAGKLVQKGPVYETNPKIEKDAVIGMVLAFHEEKAKFYQNFQVPEGMEAGNYNIKAKVTYQACDDRICLPPITVEVPVEFKIEKGEIRPEFAYMNRIIDDPPADGSFLPSGYSLDSAMSGGIWGFILLAIVMGAIAWLTPCVFPMIPITVSFFSKQANNSKKKLVALATVFCLGIVITYTGTGLLLAAFMGAAGAVQLATNPWVNLIIALLFTLFGLSLVGIFEMKLPNFLIQSTDSFSRKHGGFLGVTVMGMVFTLTAFTCTVQFVGTLLVAAAQGEWMWPIVGMLVFSFVFAAPFFFLALFPRFLQSFRSKSGPWMVQIKVVLGLIELMMVFKYLSNADLVWGFGYINRSVVLFAWTVISLLIVIVIIPKKPLLFFKHIKKAIPRLTFASVFLVITIYFAFGAFGMNLDNFTESYLPPSLEGRSGLAASAANYDLNSVESVHDLPWHNNLKSALEQAKLKNKPIFIDFTGYTCVNCRWMEKNVFAEKNVFEELKKQFILVQLYTDGGEGYEENQKLQIERFKTIALPFYVILSPKNSVLAKTSGVSSPKNFLKFLQQARAGKFVL